MKRRRSRRPGIDEAWALCAALSLSACAYQADPGPALLQPLAHDPRDPALALLEHALTGYFAEAGAAVPTTCAASAPRGLTERQEEALILRLVRLAPAPRCIEREGQTVDAITGQPAQWVQVYDIDCAEPSLCRGWVALPGAPPRSYTLRFEEGAWRFGSGAGTAGAAGQ